MITPDSRYSSLAVIVTDTAKGKQQVIDLEPPSVQTVSFTYYQVEEGDTVDQIAHAEYDSGHLWWLIADANPEILDWHTLEPGTILRIPSA